MGQGLRVSTRPFSVSSLPLELLSKIRDAGAISARYHWVMAQVSEKPRFNPEEEAFWLAVQNRDEGFVSKFYYSVRTTGIYCLPTCRSRMPRRENVAFHRSPQEAEAAGFRPCKRCQPNSEPLAFRRQSEVEKLCRLIESSEEPLPLETLAQAINASASHTHRLFKAATGVTPREYAAEHLRKQVAHELQHASLVTEAIYAAGYGSSAGFYRAAKSSLGMKPATYLAGGKGEQIRATTAPCSLGIVLVAETARGVCAISLGDDAQTLIAELTERFPAAQMMEAGSDFDDLVAKIVRLVDHPSEAVALPLDIRGTAFQKRVWGELMRIPPGITATYSELAARLDAPTATRAVAGACAANTLAVAVPCHRVIRQDGDLAGYRWGIERKRKLLSNEKEK